MAFESGRQRAPGKKPSAGGGKRAERRCRPPLEKNKKALMPRKKGKSGKPAAVFSHKWLRAALFSGGGGLQHAWAASGKTAGAAVRSRLRRWSREGLKKSGLRGKILLIFLPCGAPAESRRFYKSLRRKEFDLVFSGLLEKAKGAGAEAFPEGPGGRSSKRGGEKPPPRRGKSPAKKNCGGAFRSRPLRRAFFDGALQVFSFRNPCHGRLLPVLPLLRGLCHPGLQKSSPLKSHSRCLPPAFQVPPLWPGGPRRCLPPEGPAAGGESLSGGRGALQ